MLQAPVDGAVSFYDLWSDQQYVTAGRQVFLIVPETTHLLGRMPVNQGGAGKVKPGQLVRIRIEEQFPPGAIIAGKYKLRRVLGQGRFGTVWLAHQLTDDPLGCSCKAASIHKRGATSVARAETEPERRERAWRRAKGADGIKYS